MWILLAACAAPPTGEALVLTGWAYDWERLSHRIGLLRVELLQDSSLELGLLGGDFSTGETATDTPFWRVQYDRVVAPDTTFQEASASFEVGPEWSATTEVRFSGVEEGGSLVALLQGFRIDPGIEQSADYPEYNAAYGYTTQGFGFSAGEPFWDSSEVVVPVAATVRWSPQDRDDMNAAIPHARTGVSVRVLLVSTRGEVALSAFSSSALYPEGFTETDQPPLEIPVTLEGPGGEGFVGWRSFDLQGNFQGPDTGAGDYVRSMGAELAGGEAGRNRTEAVATGTLTNRSIIQLTRWSAGFGGEVVRIGARGTTVESEAFEGSHEVGEATIPPTLP
jgi:hypothetical protein